jgi:hypothetical protein
MASEELTSDLKRRSVDLKAHSDLLRSTAIGLRHDSSRLRISLRDLVDQLLALRLRLDAFCLKSRA